MTQCENCPHESHEFSTCLEWPECQCYNRLGVFCDNSILEAMRDLKPESSGTLPIRPNRAARRKAARKKGKR